MNEKALQRLDYGKVKEALMGYAVSYLGKRQIEQLVPMTVTKTIRKKLDETAEAKTLLQQGASVPIPSLEGVEQILALMGTGYVFSEKDFVHMLQFLNSCAQLMKYMRAKSEAAPHVSAYAASMDEIAKLKAEIERTIRSGKIVDAASKELMKVRKRIILIEDRLKLKLDSLMSKHRSILQENLLSTRGGRYVLPVKKEHRKLVKGSVLDESASGQTVYIEPADIVSFQFELAGLKAEESREEMKVLSDLTALAEQYTHEFGVNVETVGIYDFLFAKAKYALAIGGFNVELNENGVIDLREARHPLVGKQMIPLDFIIGRRYKSLVITGPNTGGKTLATKTVGLLTVLVQSGLLVPVKEGSLFSVFHHVAVDIGDGQSIEHALSTFSAHIHNVIDILKVADSSTLVLIDEMASGTDPGEGVGLSVAILEELHRRGATVVATTHFTEIKNFAAATPGFENARMEFDRDTLQPLYRLRIGEAGQSYAFLIALKLGIPEEIIGRSREISTEGYSQGVKANDPLEDTGGEGGGQSEDRAESDAYWKKIAARVAVVEETSQSSEDESAAAQVAETEISHSRSLKIGDCVYVSALGRTGIVCETEDSKGVVGVMIERQKFKTNKNSLNLHIEG